MDENTEYLLDGYKGQYYANLLDKYADFVFNDKDSELDFIKSLKEAIKDDLDFEVKIYIIRCLTLGVILHRVIDKDDYLRYFQGKRH